MLFLKWEEHEGVGCEVGISQEWWIVDTWQAKNPLSNQKGRPDIDVQDNSLQDGWRRGGQRLETDAKY